MKLSVFSLSVLVYLADVHGGGKGCCCCKIVPY
jgi:hypothetical protein